jgi:hypothetical protein
MPNALMQPQSAPVAPQPMMAQGAPPQDAPMAPQAPNGLQGAPPPRAPPVSPQQLADAHKHADVLTKGLLTLTAKPPGTLTRQDVFSEAADMIAKGGFPTPESRQTLIAEMAKLPQDEPGIRKMLGQFLMQASMNQTLLQHHMPLPAQATGG